ncbi:SirB1 family protein [Tahibacter amnicola]|uniref:Tetratricopeptide repeat protein n=1 Tax=Tahibacter amnicola TaxID=2976241 RepID=A0ABY6BGB1_9GAMM|nr:tetratricopeptide repeat protein [Tahibacter amnicola]UXI69053.1 tetratricopeptide repeat protein [Tahibacter amnicola]
MNDPWLGLQHAADRDISLLSAALLIAKDEYPDLQPAAYEERIASYAAQLSADFSSAGSETAQLSRLNGFLFGELGFAGDERNYFDPRNSYLNDVLDRRLGNPISLAVIQISVAQKLGLALEGVSFPGHFLVRLPVEEGIVVLDPFHRGRTLDLNELRRRARSELSAREVDDQRLAHLLEPASHRAIIARMLRNLKAGYEERGAWDKAVRCADRLVTLDPLSLAELRERGNLYVKLGHLRAAREDFRRYLALAPQADDAEAVLNQLIACSGPSPRIN